MQIVIDFILGLTLFEQILLGLLFAVFIYQYYFYLRYLCAPLRLYRKTAKKQISPHQTLSPASIIICARNEAENLTNFLPAVLTQDYPQYEVIVVNDGSVDNTAEVLANFALQYPHLHITFVPCGARLKSSKKLALTLGVKAAKYEHLVFTDADCKPASSHWLRDIMLGFTKSETEVVLGYGAYYKVRNFVNRFIQYDTLFNGLQYMGLAIAGHPYMGVGRNLAYKKSTFFEHKGFAGLLGSRAGDDDLFVNKVATKRNTAVVLTYDSLTWSVPKSGYREWLLQKERHLGVSPAYRLGTKLRLFFEPFSRAIFYLGLILIGCLSQDMIVWIVAGSLFVLRLVLQLTTLNVAAKRLKGQWVGLSVVFFDIFLPLNTIYLFVRHALRKRIFNVEIW